MGRLSESPLMRAHLGEAWCGCWLAIHVAGGSIPLSSTPIYHGVNNMTDMLTIHRRNTSLLVAALRDFAEGCEAASRRRKNNPPEQRVMFSLQASDARALADSIAEQNRQLSRVQS